MVDKEKIESKNLEENEKDEKISDTESLAVVDEKKDDKVEDEVSKENLKDQKKAAKAEKRRFGEVMSTGSFIRMFILLLIPGINILLIIFWALGAAKNRNRINLSRGLIVFFLIEVILALLVFGIGYIYVDRKEATVINYLDKYSNGVLTYFDIDSYDDLVKLKGISNYLVDQTEPEEVVIPKTCYVYNPEGIDSYSEFIELYNAQYNLNATDPVITTGTGDELATNEEETPSLLEILASNNVDTEESELIYIIIDNDNENSVIIFDPTGKFQAYPTIQVNGEYVYVGGAK